VKPGEDLGASPLGRATSYAEHYDPGLLFAVDRAPQDQAALTKTFLADKFYALDRDKGPHRIDEAYVKKLFSEAGFVLEESSDVLRNPADDRTKPFYDESFRGKSTDRFVLRFRKKAE